MKRDDIRSEVERHLVAVGFTSEAWTWHRSELVVAVGGILRRVKVKAGISKRAIQFELGRIAGWAEAMGLQAEAFGDYDSKRSYLVAEAA